MNKGLGRAVGPAARLAVGQAAALAATLLFALYICPAHAQDAAPPSPTDSMEQITVTAKRLEEARISIEPRIGASTYTFSSETISNLPGGEDLPLNEVLLQAPGVTQDSLASGAIHIRNEHLEVQYRINGIVLPEGVSFFGQGLDPRFIKSMQLIDGTLPAEYGLRVAGIVDMQTKSGLFEPGGAVEMRGGSYGTVEPSAQYGGSIDGYNYYVSADHLESNHGIEGVTPSYNQLHDSTIQTHAFVYLDKILDSESKVEFVAGTFQGQFQIPNNPGQVPAFGPPAGFAPIAGLTDYDSSLLSEHQNEGNSFGILSYLLARDVLNIQVSAFVKYGTLHYHPDSLGDLFFNGVAEDALRQSLATGLQGDGSYQIAPDHTLRAGFYIQGERASSDTTSAVLPITACTAADDSVAAGCPSSGVAAFGGTPETLVQDQAKTGWLYSLYLQDEWKVTPNLTINYGGRFDVVNEYTMENQISPRLNVVWKPDDLTTVHAGYASYFAPPPFELVSTATITNPVLLASSVSCASGTCTNTLVKSERAQVLDAGLTREVLPGLKLGLDLYYKYARNLLDEGQFGAPVILTPFNYHVGFNKGVELTTAYDQDNFSYYGNLAYGEEKGEGISSAQFNFSPGDLAFIATHPINTDHSQRMTASAGMSYLWDATRFSVDIIAGTGVRTSTDTGTPNEETVPSYEQVNLAVSHKFDLAGGPLTLELDLVNLLDQVYFIRSQMGVGVFAPAYGPRRTAYASVRKEFGAAASPTAAYAPPPTPVQTAAPPMPAARAPEAQREFQVFFDFGKSDITRAAARVIRAASDAVKEGDSVRVRVTGHTDTVGTAAYNQALSERRAASVKGQMVQDGVAGDEITTIGVGKTGLLVPTADGVREPQNRRAEIVLQ